MNKKNIFLLLFLCMPLLLVAQGDELFSAAVKAEIEKQVEKKVKEKQEEAARCGLQCIVNRIVKVGSAAFTWPYLVGGTGAALVAFATWKYYGATPADLRNMAERFGKKTGENLDDLKKGIGGGVDTNTKRLFGIGGNLSSAGTIFGDVGKRLQADGKQEGDVLAAFHRGMEEVAGRAQANSNASQHSVNGLFGKSAVFYQGLFFAQTNSMQNFLSRIQNRHNQVQSSLLEDTNNFDNGLAGLLDQKRVAHDVVVGQMAKINGVINQPRLSSELDALQKKLNTLFAQPDDQQDGKIIDALKKQIAEIVQQLDQGEEQVKALDGKLEDVQSGLNKARTLLKK